MNTIIAENTEDGGISYDVIGKLIDSRILFLYDYITDEMATNIVAALFYLDRESDEKISIYINSSGGDVESIFMIYDIMDWIKSPIETICVGLAGGMSALILAAGAKGMRYATNNSVIRLNKLPHSHSTESDIINAEIILEQSKRENHNFLKALRDCTGKSIKSLNKDTEKECYLYPKNAIKYGIIDFLVEKENVSIRK